MSDEKTDAAHTVLRAEYYQSVKATAEDLTKRQVAGEWDDADAMRDAIREECDETYWSIYWHAAFQCLSYSDNEVNAWSELQDMGYAPRDDYRAMVCVVASIAHRLDVEAHVGDIDDLFVDNATT